MSSLIFYADFLLFQEHLLERLFSLYYYSSFVKDQLTMHVDVFHGLCSIPLTYLSIVFIVSEFLDYYRFRVILESDNVNLLTVLLLQHHIDGTRSLPHHISLESFS